MRALVAAVFIANIVGCGTRQTAPLESCSGAEPARSKVLSLCDLSRDYAASSGKFIAVRGVYYYGLRQTCAQTCANGPWPSFVDLVGAEDTVWAKLDKAQREAEREAHRGRRVEVWMTVTGRLQARNHRSPAGPCDRVALGGYGHLGAFPAQIVVNTVTDIELVPKADSPYDYGHLYRGPA
jgi:hypothetical protein